MVQLKFQLAYPKVSLCRLHRDASACHASIGQLGVTHKLSRLVEDVAVWHFRKYAWSSTWYLSSGVTRPSIEIMGGDRDPAAADPEKAWQKLAYGSGAEGVPAVAQALAVEG